MAPEDAARRIVGECVAMRTRRLSRTVTRLFDDALRPLGLSVAQLGLLVAIQRAGPASPAAVGRILAIEKSTLSRNLARLSRARLINRQARGAGQRLTLTAQGRRMIADAYPRWREAQRSALGLLNADLAAALTQPITT